MANINKTASGLLFYDNFSESSLLWQLSPSDANNAMFSERGLRLIHNKFYTTYTMLEPQSDEYACMVKIDHIPRNIEDIAGILVMSNTKEYVECQTFLATGPSEMTNSELINADVKRLVAEALTLEGLDQRYVTFQINDEEPWENDPSLLPNEPVKPDNGTQNGEFKDKIYKYIKFTKQKHRYSFWASEDGLKWIEVGNVKFDNSGVIGFFLYATEDKELIQDSHCYINYMCLYNNRYIIIDGISRIYEFEIFDKDGTIHMRTDDSAYQPILNRSNNRAVINTINMKMPVENAILRVFCTNDYEHTITQFELGTELYGGDHFNIDKDIKVFIGQTEIMHDEVHDLGVFARGSQFVQIRIMNCDTDMATSVTVRIVRYSEYYAGEQEVCIALEKPNEDPEDLEYVKELVIPKIGQYESRNIFIRLMEEPEQGFYLAANDYRFKIMIE